MITEALDTTNLSERAHDLLRGAILSSELAPGERLHVDQIAQQLGVSLTPVKDALNRLAAEGLVVILPRRGTFVSSFDLRDLEELLDVRRVLELRAAELAVGLISSRDLRRMRSLLEDMEGLSGFNSEDPKVRRERITKDIAFHNILVSAGGNRRLVQMYERVHSHVLIARATYPLDRSKRTNEDHRAILSALERRSLPDLLAAVDTHLQHVVQNVRDAPRAGGPGAGQMGAVRPNGGPGTTQSPNLDGGSTE